MEKHSFHELHVNSFDSAHFSKQSLNLPPNFQSVVEDLFLRGSPPVWLTTIPLASNKIKLVECRNTASEDSSHDYKSFPKTGNCHMAKDARDAFAEESKEDVGRSMKNYSGKMGEDEENNEWRTVYYPSWVGEADEHMICFGEGGAKSWDDESATEKGVQHQDLGAGSTRVILMGRNRRSAEIGVFTAEKYFSEAGEVDTSLEGIEEEGLVSEDSYVRSEQPVVEDRSIGWGNQRSGVLSRDNASFAKIPSPCKSPQKKKGSNKKPGASVSGRLGSILSRFKISLSPKAVRESKATETKMIMSSDRQPARSIVRSSESSPSIGRRMNQHKENHPPAAAPHLFYNGAHTLPPNGKPPSSVSRRSISSLPPQPFSPSSSSSAPISVFPSSSLEDYPHPTFLFKPTTMDASHSSSLLTTPHRSPPSSEGLQNQRNDRGDAPQLVNRGKQQTTTVDSHLPNWNLVNGFPPCIEEKRPSLLQTKNNNREALQRGFNNDEALRAYADHLSFSKEKVDSYESDSSSDLFELDSLGGVGMGMCRRDLPVFGT